jgi:galactokinase
MTYPRAVVRRLVRASRDLARRRRGVCERRAQRRGHEHLERPHRRRLLGLAHVTRIVEHDRYRDAMPTLADVAAYASTLENGQTHKQLAGDTGVGTAGGSRDHTAILAPGRAPSCMRSAPCATKRPSACRATCRS